MLITSYASENGKAFFADCSLVVDCLANRDVKLAIIDPPWSGYKADYGQVPAQKLAKDMQACYKALASDGLLIVMWAKNQTFNIANKIPKGFYLIKDYEKPSNSNRQYPIRYSFISRSLAWKDLTDSFGEPIAFNGPNESGHPHPWDPDFVERAILHFTQPNDLVADFFAGTNTVGLTCEENNRRWIATEKNIAYFIKSRQRFINRGHKVSNTNIVQANPWVSEKQLIDTCESLHETISRTLAGVVEELVEKRLELEEQGFDSSEIYRTYVDKCPEHRSLLESAEFAAPMQREEVIKARSKTRRTNASGRQLKILKELLDSGKKRFLINDFAALATSRYQISDATARTAWWVAVRRSGYVANLGVAPNQENKSGKPFDLFEITNKAISAIEGNS